MTSQPVTGEADRAAVYVVAGAPGAGKSTVASALLQVLTPVPALLDKDVLFAGFVDEVRAASGRGVGEREGQWYAAHVKVHEYAGLTAAAAQIRAAGCPVLLVAPFTDEISTLAQWRAWVAALGGEPVRLVWVGCAASTLRQRLEARGRQWDAGKLADFDNFIARMHPETPPPVPGLAIFTDAPAHQVEQIISRAARSAGW